MHITETLPQLPTAIARETLGTLIAALPPPLADTPRDLAARDAAAIATVAALRPTDTAQALLAAQIVGAHFHAMDRRRTAGPAGEGHSSPPIRGHLHDAGDAGWARGSPGHAGRARQAGCRRASRRDRTGDGRQTAPVVSPTHKLGTPRRTKLHLVHRPTAMHCFAKPHFSVVTSSQPAVHRLPGGDTRHP